MLVPGIAKVVGSCLVSTDYVLAPIRVDPPNVRYRNTERPIQHAAKSLYPSSHKVTKRFRMGGE